jgi:hypothetical protein
MIKDKDRNHLSETDAFLYCDKELNREDILKMEKHLEGCGSCKQLVEKTFFYSNILYETVKNDLSIQRQQDCLSDMDISAYLENRVTTKERMVMEEHLIKCLYCLSIMVETKKALEEGIKEKEARFSYNKVMGAVKQQLRVQKWESLSEKFDTFLERIPPKVQNVLRGIKNDMVIMFKNTFTYPSPRFAPVFGEHEANILAPFGKVRYPIIFKWISFKEADQYIISIEAIDWSFNTSETQIKFNEEILELNYGSEYMWELKAIKGEEVVDEITGFIVLAEKEEAEGLKEIENQLSNIEPKQDRLTLWGGILEKNEFYTEAIEQYKKVYALEPLEGIAYRIAYCYDKLELEELRDEWNRKIFRED